MLFFAAVAFGAHLYSSGHIFFWNWLAGIRVVNQSNRRLNFSEALLHISTRVFLAALTGSIWCCVFACGFEISTAWSLVLSGSIIVKAFFLVAYIVASIFNAFLVGDGYAGHFDLAPLFGEPSIKHIKSVRLIGEYFKQLSAIRASPELIYHLLWRSRLVVRFHRLPQILWSSSSSRFSWWFSWHLLCPSSPIMLFRKVSFWLSAASFHSCDNRESCFVWHQKIQWNAWARQSKGSRDGRKGISKFWVAAIKPYFM